MSSRKHEFDSRLSRTKYFGHFWTKKKRERIIKEMSLHATEFFPIFIYLLVALVLSVVLMVVSMILTYQSSDTEKLTAYECGFDPFDDARSQFDVRFYLVAILFIIFDLEASFLFPWALSLSKIGSFGFWTMLDFLFELTIGFIYAWRIGSLEWE